MAGTSNYPGSFTVFVTMNYAALRLLLILLLGHGLAHGRREAGTMGAAPQEILRIDSFLRMADLGMCDEQWSTWPAIQERAIENGTVMVWKMGTSIGNIMKTFMFVLPVSFLIPTAVGVFSSCCIIEDSKNPHGRLKVKPENGVPFYPSSTPPCVLLAPTNTQPDPLFPRYPRITLSKEVAPV